MTSRQAQARSIFLRALEIDSESERRAYIEAQCGDDADLKRNVEELAWQQAHTGSFHEETGSRPKVGTTAAPSVAEEPGAQIGPYKLLQKIGEGGMGVVYVAEQQEPVKRQVALKIIKPGMDTQQVIARFEAERQALAMMDHLNIAKVLDAGATGSGRPYFVMELIDGVPFVDYCDANRLTPRERLELFVPVCQAIQHAHQKGIIHRDIKPSNVLVTMYDDKPVPKVIDFGLAKAVQQQLTERSLFTQYGTLVGTIEYMSPEQAEMSALGVDTRSDVYSLGVLLYETLTGTTPLERGRLRKAAYGEIVRLIKEEDPPRPSARLSSSDSSPKVAAACRTEPARLSALMRGELDWIVMRCLEKNRERRYETANGLARDIQRYLADEVVEARPPSAAYRLKKFLKRNKVPAIAATLVLLALVGGIAGASWGLVEARRQEHIASQEAKISQAVRDFLQNKLLGQADVEQQADALLVAGRLAAEAKPNPTIRELLDRAADELSEEKIEASFPAQPLVQASILQTVGKTYLAVGEYERAIEFLERARQLRKAELGPDHADTLESTHQLAKAYLESGDPRQALLLFEDTLARRKKTLGPAHIDTLESLNGIGMAYLIDHKPERAQGFLEEAVKLMKSTVGPKHRRTLSAITNLAHAYDAGGKPDLARELYEEAVEIGNETLGPEHPLTLYSSHDLAVVYASKHVDRFDLALPLFEETLQLMKKQLGPDHPTTLGCVMNLVGACIQAGKPELAHPLFEANPEFRKAEFGPDHPDTLSSFTIIAEGYQAGGNLDLALPLFKEVLELSKQKLGPDGPETLVATKNLAAAYEDAGKVDLALPLLAEMSSHDPQDTELTLKIAALQAWFGREEEFSATVDRALRLAEGTDAAVTAGRIAKLCCLRPIDDEARLAAVLNLARTTVERGKEHKGLANLQMALGMAEYRSGNFAAADQALQAAVKGLKNPRNGAAADFYRAMSRYRQGKEDEARRLATSAVERGQPLPENEQHPPAGTASAREVILWLAHREARALIGFEEVPPTKTQGANK